MCCDCFVPLQVFCERQKKDKKYKNKNGESKTKKVEVHNFQKDVQLSNKDYEDYLIKQQYNHLFRIIKNNKTIINNTIDDVLFIDCKNHKNYMDELEGVLKQGVSINDKEYIYWGKSASMSRQGVLGLVSSEMYDIVEKHAMMEITFDKTVLSKFEAIS